MYHIHVTKGLEGPIFRSLLNNSFLVSYVNVLVSSYCTS